MRDSQPFLIAFGILCLWPLVWVFAYHMIRTYAPAIKISIDRDRLNKKAKGETIQLKRKEKTRFDPSEVTGD